MKHNILNGNLSATFMFLESSLFVKNKDNETVTKHSDLATVESHKYLSYHIERKWQSDLSI